MKNKKKQVKTANKVKIEWNNEKSMKNEKKLSEFSIESVVVVEKGEKETVLECNLVISSDYYDLKIEGLGGENEKYELKKNKLFLPRKISKNIVRESGGVRRLISVGPEIKFLKSFVNEWFSLYKFSVENKMEDYMSGWNFSEFYSETFKSYLDIFWKLSIAGRTKEEKIVLSLKNSCSFMLASQDTLWSNDIDDTAFDSFDERMNYKHSKMKEISMEFV